MSEYKNVYIKTDGLVDIQPEYFYMTIPTRYICVYHKILGYLADLGKEVLADCSASCQGNGKILMNCWAMFQSAVACYNNNRIKDADFYVDYIKKQLASTYKASCKEEYDGQGTISLTPDGELKAIVTCGNEVRIQCNSSTGELYLEYLNSEDKSKVFMLDEEDLASE